MASHGVKLLGQPETRPWGWRSFMTAGPNGRLSGRVVCPLGLYFWGAVWTLGAWCELRQDFRNFRLDRIDEAVSLDYASPRTLDDFIKSMTRDER